MDISMDFKIPVFRDVNKQTLLTVLNDRLGREISCLDVVKPSFEDSTNGVKLTVYIVISIEVSAIADLIHGTSEVASIQVSKLEDFSSKCFLLGRTVQQIIAEL